MAAEPPALALAPDTVAEALRADETRGRTLDALDAMAAPIPRALALAAAPALVDVYGATEDRATFNQCRNAEQLRRLFVLLQRNGGCHSRTRKTYLVHQ